ncbi:hypothetical protein [uncultured Fibrobacter sp.]|uniref:hypothetical protein n=1 Tax=uncultured Fibrobacter sp. TaxID=261512 RepID=UPI0015671496|nr:hypothetical protein [uncultured Fibrobacter sp.]
MKKLLTICAAALVAFAMTGCEKTGTIEGEVCDAFTGKALEMPTIWIDSTIYSTLKDKYKYKQELRKGQFKFEKVPVGTYKVLAGRSKYIKSRNMVTTTEENPNAKLTLYIYSDQVDPGLYISGVDAPTKISNQWVIWSTQCESSIAGYRLAFPQQAAGAKVPPKADKKKGKKGKKGKAAPAADASKMTPLPEPRVVDGKLEVFYRNASSVTTPLIAKTFPAVVGKVADHKDCKGFEGDEKGVFADKDKGSDLTVTYIAENLFKITGNLPKGKQIIQFSQDGKTLQTYYFEVK